MVKTYLQAVYGAERAERVAGDYEAVLRRHRTKLGRCRVVIEPTAAPSLYYLYAVHGEPTELASSLSGQRNGDSARPLPVVSRGGVVHDMRP